MLDAKNIVKVNDTIVELDLPKNMKSSKKYKITNDESAETVENTKTTWGIATTKRRTLIKCTRNTLYSFFVSEMKYIQKD